MKGVLPNGNLAEYELSEAFEKNKEVDEWLMGSGESSATAGSSHSNNKNIIENVIETN